MKKANVTGGNLVDSSGKVIRVNYARHFESIENSLQLRATIRAGYSTDIGEYPFYLKANDKAICMECAQCEYRVFARAMRCKSKWLITGSEINWDNSKLCCSGCGERIVSHSTRTF